MSVVLDQGQARAALAGLSLDWVVRPENVWEANSLDVPELQRATYEEIARSVERIRSGSSSPGVVLQGAIGSGKTHLLSSVRAFTQSGRGYFFLIGLSRAETFWQNVVQDILDGFWRDSVVTPNNQLKLMLAHLGKQAKAQPVVRKVNQDLEITRPELDRLVNGTRGPGGITPEVASTLRALILYASPNPHLQDLASSYFQSDSAQTVERQAWGLGAPPEAQRLVMHILRILALTGHTVLAIDQIDPLIADAASRPGAVFTDESDAGRDLAVDEVAHAVMQLQQLATRQLVILSCSPNAWRLIRERGVATSSDRYKELPPLVSIRTAETAEKLIERRLASHYREVGFEPPHATWPVAPQAFQTAVSATPRHLIQQLERHVRRCLDGNGPLTELTSFDPAATTVSTPPTVAHDDLARLDAAFAVLRADADVDGAAQPGADDVRLPALLAAGLQAWITEQGDRQYRYRPDPPPSAKPPLHARLRESLDESTETEAWFSFRAIDHPHHSAYLPRLKTAITSAAVDIAGGPDIRSSRRLVVLRSRPWSGAKTLELVASLHQAGGTVLAVEPEDLRTFDALRTMIQRNDPALPAWLLNRRPASSTTLFTSTLPAPERPEPSVEADQPAAETTSGSPVPVEALSAIPVGTGPDGRILIELESLRKHAVIFAGSGSGKTVLIRRIVEEAALQGVSSIVLDPNNDLARLGDAWPTAPLAWAAGDAEKADQYLSGTDVVVWTPRRTGGRPLTFQPLPDFAGVLDDADELDQAVDVAVAALAPRAQADGRSRKAQIQRAVLQQSVQHFARHGGGSLDDFLDLLANLPPEASTLPTASAMAAELAVSLEAATVTDPLFGGRGASADPAVLLTPPPGKRARVSVISLIGLSSDEQRQSFVSQLQMALFAWFKRNPAGDRPLGGLLIMDEAQTIAPSGAQTVSGESTRVLASQARKYGLGLVFATQAPKGLHNQIVGNAATQFFGRLNSPVQIESARQLARAKGGDAPDIARLGIGDFYIALEGVSPIRAKTPHCLSHHPASPLTPEEVIARARRQPSV